MPRRSLCHCGEGQKLTVRVNHTQPDQCRLAAQVLVGVDIHMWFQRFTLEDDAVDSLQTQVQIADVSCHPTGGAVALAVKSRVLQKWPSGRCPPCLQKAGCLTPPMGAALIMNFSTLSH